MIQLNPIRNPLKNEMLFAISDADNASNQVDLTIPLIIGISAINANSSATIKKSVLLSKIPGNTNQTKGRVLLDAMMPAIIIRVKSICESSLRLLRKKKAARTAVSITTVTASAVRNKCI
jgi:hypothetical protein